MRTEAEPVAKRMKRSTIRVAFRRRARHLVTACATGLLLAGCLAGCATGNTHTAGECVGPPGFCQPYFGS